MPKTIAKQRGGNRPMAEKAYGNNGVMKAESSGGGGVMAAMAHLGIYAKVSVSI